jgi:hypothetical protein
MKKKEFLKLINELPDNAEICVFDWRKNIYESDSDGTSAGIYPNFDIEFIDDAKPKFYALSINNDDYTDDGLKID